MFITTAANRMGCLLKKRPCWPVQPGGVLEGSNIATFPRREPVGGSDPKPHADYINPVDVPDCWRERILTVDFETKAKELAVVRLMNDLAKDPN
jgi:hypothetical protein